MKIQASRDSHRTDRRYAGVYQQQGRMITDADWNELMDIVIERRREALGDVIQNGVPRDGGLTIDSVLTSGVHIHPGHLYAGGTLARLPGNHSDAISYLQQPDFPHAPDLPSAAYKLYADVWDRPLTSLEDSNVRDAALHGADTCARTQTVVQIKWCDAGLDPEKPADNPTRGDAHLSLTLRRAQAVVDPCDPCAAQELGDDPSQVGNYLFRVEVHDVEWSAVTKQVTGLTLKWSSENGAEQYALGAVPQGFRGQHWAYELFNDDTERHLGVQLGAGDNFPRRGSLSAPYPGEEQTGPYQYVRRWDGFALLTRTGTRWGVEGTDRGGSLRESVTLANDGDVTLGDVVSCNLHNLTLSLELKDRVFVAGDYWTAPVREAVHRLEEHKDEVLKDAPPTGIVHHYLTLGLVTVENGGPPKVAEPRDLVVPSSDAVRRRLDFPSLTTLLARDVGFEKTCVGLYGNAENVQEALKNLCDIDASDIAYTDPTCPPPEHGLSTVRSLLANALPTWPNLDGDAHATVKDMLDALLCRLDAAKIPYDPTATHERWHDVIDAASAADPTTVQDALDTLVQNLESSDIRYDVPPCAAEPGAPPLLKDLLQLASGAQTDVKKLWDEVLCRLNAATVPVDKGLNPPLNVPTVQSIQDALNALAGRGGRGGLASVLEDLANAVGIMPDEPRRSALAEAPVSGDQSLAESTYGMVVDILRILAAFALEFIDLKGTIVTPEGDLRIGTSASVNLRGTLRPEARAFAFDQIRERKNLWPQLSADLKNVVWCVLAEFLQAKGVDPQAVIEMGRLYGGETGYNGPAARLAFLDNVYRPLFGSTDLDHTALATLRVLVLEFLARLWKRIATDLYIREPPAITPCPANMQWLQADDVQRVLRRLREPDGLLRIHAATTVPVPPAPRIAMERLGAGGTWVIRDEWLERYRHDGVHAALDPTELRAGRPCPPPHDVLQFATGFQVRHAAGAVFAGKAALEIVYTDPGVSLPQLIVVNVDSLPGGIIPAPTQLPFHRKLQLFGDARMVLGDGLHSSVAHWARQTNVLSTGAVSQDFFVVLEGGFSQLQSTSDGSVLAVYNLTIDGADAGPSHALIVEAKGGQQRLMLISGADRPLWTNRGLALVAHTALHADVAVVGVAHDQIILQVVQPTGSGDNAKWTFVPFRTLAESLWGTDRLRFEGFSNTLHPDGSRLFTSLGDSVTPPTVIREPITEPPFVEPPIIREPIVQPPITQPIRGQPLDIAGTPLVNVDLTLLGGRTPLARPLPLFDGVVRRAGPAGSDGWLTVLAEDEMLGLYQSFRGLLPVSERRFHVRHARSVVGLVADNRIVMGDVTESALQFELGAVVNRA